MNNFILKIDIPYTLFNEKMNEFKNLKKKENFMDFLALTTLGYHLKKETGFNEPEQLINVSKLWVKNEDYELMREHDFKILKLAYPGVNKKLLLKNLSWLYFSSGPACIDEKDSYSYESGKVFLMKDFVKIEEVSNG